MTERDWTQDDALLVAYLDGNLPEEEKLLLEARLSDDPELRARLEAMDVDLGPLRSEFDQVLEMAPPFASPPQPSLNVVRYAAAACLALALLFGGWMLGTKGAADDWRDFAAAYHLLYRSETLASARSGDGGIANVSTALGRDLSALSDVAGLDFRRAQVLGWKDKPLIQLAYLDADGRPFAICVIEATGASTSVESELRHGLPTASFANGPYQIMVIGAEGAETVGAIAHEVSQLL